MKYIMITGASSGIGEETARFLARQEDVTTILVARNEEKLKKDGVNTEKEACKTHNKIGKIVRKAIKEAGRNYARRFTYS